MSRSVIVTGNLGYLGYLVLRYVLVNLVNLGNLDYLVLQYALVDPGILDFLGNLGYLVRSLS